MAAPPQLVGQVLGHYRICEQIGSGGMGVVYRAHDLRLDRDVAIKVLPPGMLADKTARRRFRKEALTLSRLNHPNIETIFDFNTHEGVDFLVTEYIPGTMLSEKLAHGALPEEQTVLLGRQLAEGLCAAHERGIVHCDLKPANLRITTIGSLKILDFGLAKHFGAMNENVTTETIRDMAVGTLPYMAPEQLQSNHIDFRTDVYAMGAVLYEMGTGKRLFPDMYKASIVDAILHKSPTLPRLLNPRLSSRLEEIICKAIDKAPERRYQSVKDLLVDFERLNLPTGAAVSTARSQMSRMQLVLIGVGIVLVIASILAIIALLPSLHSPTRTAKIMTVLVADFENRTGEPVFDDTLRELLTTTFEQSPYLHIFPISRVPYVLQRMERSGQVKLDEATGREICLREGLQALVVGSISRIGNNYVLVARATRPDGQNIVSAQRIVPHPSEVPNAVDAVSKELRIGLGESLPSIKDTSVPLENVTSKSLDAIRYFSIGKVHLYAGNAREANTFFESAVELDPEFAMAHDYLGIANVHLDNPLRATQHLYRATQLAGRVGEIERHKILGDYDLEISNYDDAIAHFRILTQLQPQDPAAYLNLGDCYAGKFQFDSALAEIDEGIRLQSHSGPQENRAEILFLKGDLPSAISTAQVIVRNNSKDLRARIYLAQAYLLSDRMGEARAVLESMVRDGGQEESEGLSGLADIALSNGHYREATSRLEAAVVIDKKLGNTYAAAKKKILLAILTHRLDSIHTLTDEVTKPSEVVPQLALLLGLAFAQGSDLPHGRRVLAAMEQLAAKDPVPKIHSFQNILSAELAIATRNVQSAVDAAEKAVTFEESTLAIETLAHAYKMAGRNKDAIDAYERLITRRSERSRTYDGPAFYRVVQLHYELGLLYQKTEQWDRARTHLQAFLKYWSRPDPDLKVYNDAEKRLRSLKLLSSQGRPTPAM